MNSTTKPIVECTEHERARCYELMQIEFAGVTYDNFINDFNEKEFVMILTDELGVIVGFSTLMEMDINVEGEMIKVIFSGDTTVLQEHRDSFGFGIELSKFFFRAINLYPCQMIYYVLITKGWRTYRVLPFYFKDFFPCYSREMNSYEKTLVKSFGYKKYPNNFIEETGLICFEGETERLRPESPDSKLPPRNNQHVNFFFEKNPTYLDGTELVCMAKVSPSNLSQVVNKLLSISESTNNKYVK